MNIMKKTFSWLMAISIAALIFPTVALADTNGSEIQITDQPDKLILQLGPHWAGVEFELKTDAGVFPVPVVVDSTGVLKMDLGGSKTYILSSLATAPEATSPQPIPDPTEPPASSAPENTPIPEATRNAGIPALQLVIFLVGLSVAVGGLLAMRYYKKRRDAYYEDYDDGDDYD